MTANAATTENDGRRFRTVPFRISFPHVLKPKKDPETQRESFQLSMLFPAGTDTKPFKAALAAAMVKKFGADKSKWPRLKRGPNDVIRDAKEYSDDRVANKKTPLEGYDKGWIFVRASAQLKNAPKIVGPVKGADGKFPVLTDEREVYPGRWARATIEAYYYPRNGGGVTFALCNVQCLKHDKNLGGAITAAEEDFDDVPEAMEGDDFDSGAQTSGAPADNDGW